MGNIQITLLRFTVECPICPRRSSSATCDSSERLQQSQQSSPNFNPEEIETPPPTPRVASRIETASLQSQASLESSSWSIISPLADAHYLLPQQRTGSKTILSQPQLLWNRAYLKVYFKLKIRKRLAKQWSIFSVSTQRNSKAGIIDPELNRKFSSLGNWLALHILIISDKQKQKRRMRRTQKP